MTSGVEQPVLMLAGAGWLVSEAIMMPVMYVSGVALLLLAVLYASSPSRRPTTNASGREDTIPEGLAGFVETNASGSFSPVAEVEHTKHDSGRDSGIDQQLRQMEGELALLRSKIERLEKDATAREEDRRASGEISLGSRTADLRRELEALRAELSSDS